MRGDLDLKTYWHDYCVSTVALSTETLGGNWYETYIFPSDGKEITGWLELWGCRYPTRDEAVAGHEEVVALLKSGALELDER